MNEREKIERRWNRLGFIDKTELMSLEETKLNDLESYEDLKASIEVLNNETKNSQNYSRYSSHRSSRPNFTRTANLFRII